MMEQNDINDINAKEEAQEETANQNATTNDPTTNFDINKFITLLNKLNKNVTAENILLKKNDTRIDVLNFLKDFLPQDKKVIIDQVIDVFSEKPSPPDS